MATLKSDLKGKAEAKEQKTGVTSLCLELWKEEAQDLSKRSREEAALRMLQGRRPSEKTPEAHGRSGIAPCSGSVSEGLWVLTSLVPIMCF